MAANARTANAMRHAGSAEYVLRTCPPRETNTTSITMRMKKVTDLAPKYFSTEVSIGVTAQNAVRMPAGVGVAGAGKTEHSFGLE